MSVTQVYNLALSESQRKNVRIALHGREADLIAQIKAEEEAEWHVSARASRADLDIVRALIEELT